MIFATFNHAYARNIFVALFVSFLSSCTIADDFVPLETIDHLKGEWTQIDGSAYIRFYDDENISVKFTIADSNPPKRFLSTLETMKDGFAFSLGNRWEKPVEVLILEDKNRIDLLMPGDKERETWHMKRKQ